MFRETKVQENILKYQYIEEERVASYRKVLELFQSKFFVQQLNRTIANCPFNGVFFETPPVSANTLDKPFEFVLVDAPQLERITAEENPFDGKLKKFQSPICAFPNINHDAMLVVPNDLGTVNREAYAHLANFVRKAPQDQTEELWHEVGRNMTRLLEENPTRPRWLSTSGLGVYWLHVRLCLTPKYYSFKPYTTKQ